MTSSGWPSFLRDRPSLAFPRPPPPLLTWEGAWEPWEAPLGSGDTRTTSFQSPDHDPRLLGRLETPNETTYQSPGQRGSEDLLLEEHSGPRHRCERRAVTHHRQ